MQGSPPRVRGKVYVRVVVITRPGITPARAGKRGRGYRVPPAVRDHPRACGEKMAAIIEEHADEGSPPRVRGKELGYVHVVWLRGITPARAGKSLSATRLAERAKDHPRACGEKLSGSCRYHSCTGSPPRVRGKVCCCKSMSLAEGITPARAGKRISIDLGVSSSWDHPRACGEKGACLGGSVPV